jgi:ribosome-associated protein
MADLPALELAVRAADLCAGKGAEDVAVLRMPKGPEYDYLVVASARSERQSHTLVDEVFGFCKKHRVPHRPIEGDTGWFLIDCHSVVVHAMGEAQRAYYQLEKMWKDAVVVDWQAELARLPKLDA